MNKPHIKSLVFYSSNRQLTAAHCPVRTENSVVYVRAVESEWDVSTALDEAAPLEGENMLNTMPFEKPVGAPVMPEFATTNVDDLRLSIQQLRAEVEKYQNLYLNETKVLALLMSTDRVKLAQVTAARTLLDLIAP